MSILFVLRIATASHDSNVKIWQREGTGKTKIQDRELSLCKLNIIVHNLVQYQSSDFFK